MKVEKPLKLLDIADMPKFDSEIKDGVHSVSEGKIFWTDNNGVTCRQHGACNAVNKDLSIWRCLTCHEGAYVVWKKPQIIRCYICGKRRKPYCIFSKGLDYLYAYCKPCFFDQGFTDEDKQEEEKA